tara:strand:+ start:599 stop:805 length:207 start_codon:yes stop_codon:yes gene_type:complete
MTFDDTRDNTATIEATIIEADAREDVGGATWSECKCDACTGKKDKGFENHVGDGPSGFDFAHDTKWCC